MTYHQPIVPTPLTGGYVTIDEASRRLSRCPEVVRRYIREGKLRGIKLGQMWHVHSADLAEFERRRAA